MLNLCNFSEKLVLITLTTVVMITLFSLPLVSGLVWADGPPTLTPRDKGTTSFWDNENDDDDVSEDKTRSGILLPRGEDRKSYWDNESEDEKSGIEGPERQLMLEEAGSRGETTGSRDSSDSDSARRGGRGLTGAGTNVILDRTPPVIAEVTKGNVGTSFNQRVIITWKTDEPATSLVNYGRIDGDMNSASSSDALVTDHYIYLGDLHSCDADTNVFNFEVVSVDKAENLATSTDEDGEFGVAGACGGSGR